MATWPVVTGTPVPSTNINELNQRVSGTVEAAASTKVDTTETSNSTSYTNLATAGPAVTVTLRSTRALVMWSAFMRNMSAGNTAITSFAVSGASTLAASDLRAIVYESGAANDVADFGSQRVVSGLSTGSNTFTLKYRVGAASTGEWRNRNITVIPL